VEDTAALAGAAVAPEAAGATRGLVVDDRRVGDGAVRRGTIDEAATLARAAGPAVPAAALVAAVAADGLVVGQPTIADVPIGEEIPQPAPLARAAGPAVPAAAAVPAGAADRFVVFQQAIADMKRRGDIDSDKGGGRLGAADGAALA